MTRISATIIRLTQVLLFLSSVNVFAAEGNIDLSKIEADERAKIYYELSYRLETKENCNQTLNWDDSGSGADLDGYFFIPNTGKSEYIIGGHASYKRKSNYHCVTTVNQASSNAAGMPPLLVAPSDWKQVWKDSGSGATKDGSFWQAIPPDNNYRCIGSVSQLLHNRKPDLPNYRCVHASLTEKVRTKNLIWSDKGSGADKKVSVLGLPTTGTYIAVAGRVSQLETVDLKKDPTGLPDEKTVEEILAKRMAPYKAEIEAKEKALQEQKQAAEAEQKAAAKKAAKIAEEKKRAEALEKEKIAKQKAVAEQARIAKLEEEKAAIQIEKEKSNQQQKEAEPEPVKQEPVKMPETIVQEVSKTEQVETSRDSSDISDNRKESKGLNDLLMFFLKVFGILVGGVVVFVVAFKLLFGSKKQSN
jgi:Vacuolar protein sorting-associated protein 62